MHVYLSRECPDHQLLGLYISHEQYYDTKTPNYKIFQDICIYICIYISTGPSRQKTLFFCILDIRLVVYCVHDSAQTSSHICTYVMPINCIIIVDVQHTCHFDLDLISDRGQGHKTKISACFI